jgi:hypothetical protein
VTGPSTLHQPPLTMRRLRVGRPERLVSAERSCIHPFIRRTQAVLRRTGSLSEALEEIARYQNRAKKVYRVDVHCVHRLALSSPCLCVLAVYEYLRHRGVPLPDSRTAVRYLMPLKEHSEKVVLGQKPDGLRHKAMAEGYE